MHEPTFSRISVINPRRNKHRGLFGSLGDMRAADAVVLLLYAIWLFFMIMNTSLFAGAISGGVFSAIRVMCITGATLLGAASSRYSVGEMIFLFICGVLCVVFWKSSQLFQADTLVWLFALRQMDYRAILKASIAVTAFAMIFVFTCSALGIIVDYVNVEYAGAQRIRHYLGFRYALFRPNICLALLACLWCYVSGKDDPLWSFCYFLRIIWSIS